MSAPPWGLGQRSDIRTVTYDYYVAASDSMGVSKPGIFLPLPGYLEKKIKFGKEGNIPNTKYFCFMIRLP
jgi:hypothetical protein